MTKQCLWDFFTRQIFICNQSFNNIYSETNSIDTNDYFVKKRNVQNELNDINNFTKTFKIVHKDQDAINSFCLNEVIFLIFFIKSINLLYFKRNKNTLAFCTNKEIIEVEISDLLINNAAKLTEDSYFIETNTFNPTQQQIMQNQVYDQDVYVLGDFSLNFSNQYNSSLSEQKLTHNPGSYKSFRLNSLAKMVRGNSNTIISFIFLNNRILNHKNILKIINIH